MSFGLRVTLTEKDIAALAALAARAPHLVDAPWEERRSTSWTALFSDKLDEELAFDLRVRGLDVVRDAPVAAEGLARPSAPARKEAIPAVAGAPSSVRKAAGLLEAVRPVRVNDDVPEEALFFCRIGADASGAAAGGAQRTLERLLLLGRDDASIAEVDTSDGRCVVVGVREPPLYLLLRAREERAEGVRAFVRAKGANRVYSTWGTLHPLAALLDERLTKANRSALVDEDGKITLLPATWPSRPILDGIQPEIAARKDVLAPAAGALKFPVRLRLGPAATDGDSDPELWLLKPEELARLEMFIEASPADDVGRLLVSRVAASDGRPLYVLRESVRPQMARLGPRVSSLLEQRGYSRAPALDNLYVPPARRLTPSLTREQLKALLGLDEAALVVVDEDGDGLTVTAVAQLEDAPLSRFTTWIATDRRRELDRLMEEAALSFPGVVVERAETRTRTPEDEAAAREAAEKRPAPKSPREMGERVRPELRRGPDEDEAGEKDMRALRVEARQLEAKVLGGGAGAVDANAWRSLGLLKQELNEVDDAASCLEVALFLGAPAGDTAADLRATRKKQQPDQKEPPLLDLVVSENLAREAAGLLGARLVQAIAKGEPLMEDALQHATELFQRDDIMVARRLQWAVLHAICARAKDALGATRAKEAVLGALNARGLSETLDLPRFVRTSLALLPDVGADGTTPLDRTRHEQLVQLEKLFARCVAQPLALTNANNAFLRAIFAVGLGRLGGRGPEIVKSLQNELDVHDAPNRVLLQLYIARLAYFVSKGTVEGWKKELDATVATLSRPEDKRVVEWLVKRSQWLRAAPPDEQPPGLRPALERHLAGAEKHPEDLPASTMRVHEMPGLYDYEVATAIERVLKAALATGRDELIRSTLLAAMKGLARIRILAHRVRALGSCVRASATLEDSELLDQCLDGIANAAASPNVPSVRDLLVAVKPALAALRRLGAVEPAQRFLASLEPVAAKSDRETGALLAALSEGFLQLGDVDHAKGLIGQALARAFSTSTAHVDRYETGAAVLEALAHWDLEARVQQCDAILGELGRFTDTFTTSRFFATHQILIAERLVETVVDDVTLRSDKLQAYLDTEEQNIRRRILQQWSALCGR